ncbi:MAG: hypothetical protein IPN59_13100 [Holophaga sp.]|nr:hypothetical protein [Holophaga sp.]
MAKIFYTERDIEDMYARGVTSIEVHDNVVLTDLARERMFKLNMQTKRVDPKAHPEDNPRSPGSPHQGRRPGALNGQADPVLLDTVIRRVLADKEVN